MRSSVHSPSIRSRYDYYYSSTTSPSHTTATTTTTPLYGNTGEGDDPPHHNTGAFFDVRSTTATTPTTTAINFYDNQTHSLFGDPVPPSTDFLENIDNHLYGSFRRSSNNNNNNINLKQQSNDFHLNQTSTTSSSPFAFNHNNNTNQNYTKHYPASDSMMSFKLNQSINTPPSHPPPPPAPPTNIHFNDERLNSNNSNSNNNNNNNNNNNRISFFKDDTTFNDFNRRRSSSSFSDDFHSNLDNFRNINEMLPSPSIQQIRSNGPRIFSGDHPQVQQPYFSASTSRRLSNQSNMSVDSLRRLSYDSHQSSDGIAKTNHNNGEWSKIPKLTTNIKNNNPPRHTTEINHGSAMVAIIQDSTSSSDERTSPPVPLPDKPLKMVNSHYKPYQVRPYENDTIISMDNSNKENNIDYYEGERPIPFERQSQRQSIDRSDEIPFNSMVLPLPPPSSSSNEMQPRKDSKQSTSITIDESTIYQNISTNNNKRDLSPAIIKDTVTTGSTNRLSEPRQHKKKSFAIITELSPNPSRATSPTSTSGRVSPFLGKGFKPPTLSSNSRPSSRAAESPYDQFHPFGVLPIDDESGNKPSVQFNMSTFPDRMMSSGSRSSTPASRSILQNIQRNRSGSIADPIKQTHKNDNAMDSYEIETDVKLKTLIQIPQKNQQRNYQDPKPFSILPQISPKYHNEHNPLELSSDHLLHTRQKMHKSLSDLTHSSTIQMKNNSAAGTSADINPKRYQRGLLRIVSSAGSSPSRIPRRKSVTTIITSESPSQPNDLINNNQMASSTTNSLSTDNNNLIDLGVMTTPSRTSAGNQQRLMVSKPTSLSPIIGTPNKEQQQQFEYESQQQTDLIQENPTKIPVRSSANHRQPNNDKTIKTQSIQSKPNSKSNSRDTSPQKYTINSASTTKTKGIITNTTTKSNNKSESTPFSSRRGSLKFSNDSIKLKKTISTTKGTIGSTRSPTRSKSPSSKSPRNKSPPSKSPRNKSPMSKSPRNKSPMSKSPMSRSPMSKSPRSKSPIANARKPPPKSSTLSSSFRRNTPISSSATRKETPNIRSSIKKPMSNITAKREPSNLKREPSNLKRQPSNLNRESSNLKRQPSNLSRESSNLKRQPSNLSRESSNLKRQPSNLSRESSNLKRETSSLRMDTSSIGSNKNLNASSSTSNNAKRQQNSITKSPRETSAALSKNNSDSNLMKKLEKKGSFRGTNRRRTSSAGDDPSGDEANDTFEKLIPLTKSNVISMTTAAITAQPVHITTTVTNQLHKRASSTNLLATNSNTDNNGNQNGKSLSDNQITAPVTPVSMAGQHAISTLSLSDELKDTILETPATIIEKSQKTLENIQKSLSEATEEIQKTIEENLTDLKSLENDMKIVGEEIVRNSPIPFEKRESSKTLKSLKDETIAEVPEDNPTTANATDEMKYDKSGNVITRGHSSGGNPMKSVATKLSTARTISSANLKPHSERQPKSKLMSSSFTTNNEDERFSENAITSLPEVELESGNTTNNMNNKMDKVPPGNGNGNQEKMTAGMHDGDDDQLRL